MKKSLLLSCVALAAVSGFSLSANAQSPTCADVVWGAEALLGNPTLQDNCLEVVQRNGAWYARMRAKVVRQGATSTVVRWQNPDGSFGSSERAYPPKGMAAYLGDEEVQITDLQPNQEVNVYVIDEGNFTLPATAAAPAAAAPAAPAAASTAAAPAAPPPPAAAEPEEEPAALPTTSGQTYWFAILGAMLLLLAGAVHVVRSRF